jgi:hypothetical protein
VRKVLINSNISFALKDACGQYEIKEISIFEIEKVKKFFPYVEINSKRNKELCFTMKCPLCSEVHLFKYNINEFFKREVVIGGCETLGIPLFYIGNHCKVHERIKKFNDLKNDIYAMI